LKEAIEEYPNSVDVMGLHIWLECCYKRGCDSCYSCYKQEGLKNEVVGNARSALAKGKQLLKSHPDQYDLNYPIGHFHSELGEWDSARKSFQKYIDAEARAGGKYPGRRGYTYLQIAKICGNEGKWPEAVEWYQKVIDDHENPHKALKAEALFCIAEVYLAHGTEIFRSEEKARREALIVCADVIKFFPEKECVAWRKKAEQRRKELATGLAEPRMAGVRFP
jgi:tetratricopeptide (TPR) repeat protein